MKLQAAGGRGLTPLAIQTGPPFSFTDSSLTKPLSRNVIPCLCAIRERPVSLSLWRLLSCHTVVLPVVHLLSPNCLWSYFVPLSLFDCGWEDGLRRGLDRWCWGLWPGPPHAVQAPRCEPEALGQWWWWEPGFGSVKLGSLKTRLLCRWIAGSYSSPLYSFKKKNYRWF